MKAPTLDSIIAELESDERFTIKRCGGCVWVQLTSDKRYSGVYVGHESLLWAHRREILTAYVLEQLVTRGQN